MDKTRKKFTLAGHPKFWGESVPSYFMCTMPHPLTAQEFYSREEEHGCWSGIFQGYYLAMVYGVTVCVYVFVCVRVFDKEMKGSLGTTFFWNCVTDSTMGLELCPNWEVSSF